MQFEKLGQCTIFQLFTSTSLDGFKQRRKVRLLTNSVRMLGTDNDRQATTCRPAEPLAASMKRLFVEARGATQAHCPLHSRNVWA